MRGIFLCISLTSWSARNIFSLQMTKRSFPFHLEKNDIFNNFQIIFSVCRWQKEVFPSTWANNSTWGIYISSCSDYEGWLWQRSWWVEVLEYKIERRCYFVSPASTSSYFSKWKWKWKWMAMLLCEPSVHQFILLKVKVKVKLSGDVTL